MKEVNLEDKTFDFVVACLTDYRDRLEAGIAVTLTKAEARESNSRINRVNKAIRELTGEET